MNPVKLFVGLLVADPRLVHEVVDRLEAEYGPIDHRSPVVPFNFTDYYTRDMGDILDRVLFSFERLIESERLSEIKRRTNKIEEEIRPLFTAVSRPGNIDPGYMEHAKVVLASTKNFYHRIYLGDGIFGEVTMHFRNNTYQFFPWTYPDYKSPDYQEFFLRMRQIYRSQLKKMCILKQKD